MFPIRLAGTVLTLAAALAALAQDTPDRIFTGGPVLTMNDAQLRAEAVAAKAGLIIAVGSIEEGMKLKGAATEVTDLEGHALIPGFVDAHCHIFGGGIQAPSANLLAAPDGEVTDIASLQQTLRDWSAENRAVIEKANLIMGFGYDQSQFAELRHATRADLDAVLTEFPAYVVHQSGHLGAANSKALEVAGITAASENPPGSVILRDAAGDPFQRRGRVRHADCRVRGRRAQIWLRRPLPGADPRSVPARGSGGCDEAAGDLPVAVSDAHLLPGRLASRPDRGARAGRKHLAHRLDGGVGDDVQQPSRRADGLSGFHAGAGCHGHPPFAVGRHHRRGQRVDCPIDTNRRNNRPEILGCITRPGNCAKLVAVYTTIMEDDIAYWKNTSPAICGYPFHREALRRGTETKNVCLLVSRAYRNEDRPRQQPGSRHWLMQSGRT